MQFLLFLRHDFLVLFFLKHCLIMIICFFDQFSKFVFDSFSVKNNIKSYPNSALEN